VRKVSSLPKQKLLILMKCFCIGRMPSCTYILRTERTVSGLKAVRHCLSLLCGGSAKGGAKFTRMHVVALLFLKLRCLNVSSM
jgi:hypothetical protein